MTKEVITIQQHKGFGELLRRITKELHYDLGRDVFNKKHGKKITGKFKKAIHHITELRNELECIMLLDHPNDPEVLSEDWYKIYFGGYDS